MLPWQQMCNGKHFAKSDITSYYNGIGFPSMDIWQIHVKSQAKFLKTIQNKTKQKKNKKTKKKQKKNKKTKPPPKKKHLHTQSA